MRCFEGNYTMYEKDRKQRLGIEADRRHRIKYHILSHEHPLVVPQSSHTVQAPLRFTREEPQEHISPV